MASGLVACAAPDAPDDDGGVMRELYDHALPYYQQGTAGTFTGAEGATIAYQAFTRGAPDAIVLAPGRTQGSHTFMQLLYELRDAPYDIYVLDHRGQGASARLLADPLPGHVDRFEHYILDYGQFVREVVVPERYERTFAVAHSMGGAITLRYAIDHPDTFDAIVLSAPMLQIYSGPVSEDVLLSYASSVDPELTIPVGYDWIGEPSFSSNYLTNDPHQFAALFETDKIYPERRVGRATYGWTAESIVAERELRAMPDRITAPVLLFQAGADGVVVPEAQTAFCEAVPRCERVVYPVARHELFFAERATRSALLDRMLAFLADPPIR